MKHGAPVLLCRLVLTIFGTCVAVILLIETQYMANVVNHETVSKEDTGRTRQGSVTYLSLREELEEEEGGELNSIQHHAYDATGDTDGVVEVDMIFPVVGELGNHLWKLSHSHNFITLLEEKFLQEKGQQIKIKAHYKKKKVFKKKTPTLKTILKKIEVKAQRTAEEVRQCFPKFSNALFFSWSSEFYESLQEQLTRWVNSHPTYSVSSIPLSDMDPIISSLEQVILAHQNNQATPFAQDNAILSIPYVEISDFPAQLPSPAKTISNKELFAMDEDNPFCCQKHPYQKETVLHIRGTAHELETRQNNNDPHHPPRPIQNAILAEKSKELSPQQIAHDLLSHLQPEDRVAIISRYPDELDEHVQELNNRGIHVRIVEGHTGVQDFCFLKRGKKVAGQSTSTFFKWAAALSDAQRVDSYAFHGSEVEFKRKTSSSKGGKWKKHDSY